MPTTTRGAKAKALKVAGIAQPVALRRSRRKTVGIAVHFNGGVVVTAPLRLAEKQVAALVQRRAGWVNEKLQAHATMRARFPTAHAFGDGETVWFLGQPLTLRLRQEPTARVARVQLAGDVLHVVLRATDGEKARRAVVNWYRREAAILLAERVTFYTARTGLSPRGVEIGEWRRQWGQCRVEAKTLRFNWRILQTPSDVVDYLVVHELMHLREANHSPRFWGQVASVLPDYKRRRAWLRDWGAPLLLFGRKPSNGAA